MMIVRQLQNQIQACSKAPQIIEAVAAYVDDEAKPVSLDFLNFILLKTVPLIYKTPQFADEFFSVFELACLRAQPYDLFITFFETLPSLIKDKKIRDLIEPALKNFVDSGS